VSAWAVPALIPTTPATPPDTNTVVANPTISRFTNLGSFSTAASRLLGIWVNRDVRFILVPLVAVGSWSALLQWTPPALLPIPISRAIHRFKLTHYRNSVLGDAGRRMLLAVNAYYSPGKGVHGLGSGGGGLSPSQMLRSGPPTFPCPQLTIQKVWQTLQSQPTLGPGEAGPGFPPGGMWAFLGCPGHQLYGPSGRAWAVPAPGPKAASPRPPDTNTVIANPAIPRFIGLTVFARELGKLVNREIRFMLVLLLLSAPGWRVL